MSEEKIKDMILKQCLELTTNNDFRPPISAYNGVDIDDVVRACKQLQDKKTYIDLVKENQELKKQLEEVEYILGLRQKRNLIHKFDKEYDEEDKKKNPNRDYAGIMPDAEEVYRRYYAMKDQQKEFIEWLEDNWNTTQDIWYIKILNKYKSIIGCDKSE